MFEDTSNGNTQHEPHALRPKAPPIPTGDRVPSELLNLKRWCGWRYSWSEAQKKWTKLPTSPRTGQTIGVTPQGKNSEDWESHWVDFETARLGALRLKLDGVGFVFVEGDGYLGTDIDCCRNPENGEIHPAVSHWLELAAKSTYCEASPSKTGVHAIGRAKLPGAGNKKPMPGVPKIKIEMYDSGRFFTFSGLSLSPDKLIIGDYQRQVSSLHHYVFPEREERQSAHFSYVREFLTDAVLQERLCRSAKWAVLFDETAPDRAHVGQEFTKKHYAGDDSAADAALCTFICRYSRSPLQVERLWKKSALWRPKAQDRPDYVQRTIVSGMEASGIHGAGMDEYRMRPIEWFWEGRLPFGALVIIDGDPGMAKSMLALSLIVSAITGKAFLDGTTPRQTNSAILLSAEDDPETTIKPRLRAAGLPKEMDNRVRLFTNTKADGRQRSINDPEDLLEIEMAIAEVAARIVVIDPLNSFLGGSVDSHNDKSVRRAIAPLAELAHRTGCLIVVLRHLTKTPGGKAAYRGQGSIAYIGAARAGFLVARHPDQSRKSDFVFAMAKANLSATAGSLIYHLKFTEVLDDNGNTLLTEAREERTGRTLMVPQLVPYVAGLERCDLSADDLLGAEADEAIGGKLRDAVDFLKEALKDGPVLADKVGKDAKVAGITEMTVRRARETLKVHSGQKGRKWYWMLPEHKKDFEVKQEKMPF